MITFFLILNSSQIALDHLHLHKYDDNFQGKEGQSPPSSNRSLHTIPENILVSSIGPIYPYMYKLNMLTSLIVETMVKHAVF